MQRPTLEFVPIPRGKRSSPLPLAILAVVAIIASVLSWIPLL